MWNMTMSARATLTALTLAAMPLLLLQPPLGVYSADELCSPVVNMTATFWPRNVYCTAIKSVRPSHWWVTPKRFKILKLHHTTKRCISFLETKLRNSEFMVSLRANAPYLGNGAIWSKLGYNSHIGICIRAFDWYRNWSPWMSLNDLKRRKWPIFCITSQWLKLDPYCLWRRKM